MSLKWYVFRTLTQMVQYAERANKKAAFPCQMSSRKKTKEVLRKYKQWLLKIIKKAF